MTLVFTPPAATLLATTDGQQFPVHRVYCVGRNYAEHAIEMGATGREAPFFFLKPADALVQVPDGATGLIPYPTLTANLHHEVELVVALGQGGRNIPVDQALNHVWGYAIGLDMTRRDLQNDMKKQGRPWEIGKAYEQSAPIGPLHPAASWGPVSEQAISLDVNGQRRQTGKLSDLIWSVAETIAILSQAWTLQPGDLIYTGTPAGVGPVLTGDVMSARIDGMGELCVAVGPAQA